MVSRMEKKTLAQEFKERTADILARAKQGEISLNQICRGAGAARATPDRWAIRVPKSITLVDDIEAELTRLENEKKAAQELEK